MDTLATLSFISLFVSMKDRRSFKPMKRTYNHLKKKKDKLFHVKKGRAFSR